MRILSYNTQTGEQGEEFFLSLLKHPCDYYCFQRFSKAWLPLAGSLNSFYQSSYEGSEFGCATFTPHSVTSESGNTLSRSFKDRSQSTAYIITHSQDFNLINTLPPYPSDDATETECMEHLEKIKKLSTDNTIVVGDFHRDLSDTPQNYFTPLKNYANKTNFYGRHSNALSLTKLLANIPIKINNEQVIALPAGVNVHLPVIFDFYLSDET